MGDLPRRAALSWPIIQGDGYRVKELNSKGLTFREHLLTAGSGEGKNIEINRMQLFAFWGLPPTNGNQIRMGIR